jgi:hypothetical protein
LRVDARIGGTAWCGVLHGRTLLRQVGALRCVMDVLWNGNLSPNSAPRPLNSMAFGVQMLSRRKNGSRRSFCCGVNQNPGTLT